MLSSVFQLGRTQPSIDVASCTSDERGHRCHIAARGAEVHDARSQQVFAIHYRVGHVQLPAGLQFGKQRRVELVEVAIDGGVAGLQITWEIPERGNTQTSTGSSPRALDVADRARP